MTDRVSPNRPLSNSSNETVTGPQLPPLPPQARLSVVVPIYNEERFIADTLHQLLDQDFPPERVEILVCDGGSTDRTCSLVQEIAARDRRVRLLHNPLRRSSAGRNTGFRAATGEMVLVIDGHVRIDNRRLFTAVERCFRTSGAAVLARPQPLLPSAPGTWSEAIAAARDSRLGHSPDSTIFGAREGFVPAASSGAAYRREVFDLVGYVDEEFDACEDLEFNTRCDLAGLRCFTSPDLSVGYYARTSPGGLFRQMHRYGFGRFRYITRHPSRLTLAQILPAGLILGWAVLPGAFFLFRPLFWLGLALTGLYAATVLAFSAWLAQRSRWSHFPRFLVLFPAIHLGLGTGFLSSLLRGGRLRPLNR